jgi:hypothetical protein
VSNTGFFLAIGTRFAHKRQIFQRRERRTIVGRRKETSDMTPEEHSLIVTMLHTQGLKIQTLVEVLKSRGILQDDDWPAFQDLAELDHRINNPNRDVIIEQYVASSKNLGVDLTGKQETFQAEAEKK